MRFVKSNAGIEKIGCQHYYNNRFRLKFASFGINASLHFFASVWNVMQRLRERISEEEAHAVRQMNADQAEGQRDIPVLFEEMNGVHHV